MVVEKRRRAPEEQLSSVQGDKREREEEINKSGRFLGQLNNQQGVIISPCKNGVDKWSNLGLRDYQQRQL